MFPGQHNPGPPVIPYPELTPTEPEEPIIDEPVVTLAEIVDAVIAKLPEVDVDDLREQIIAGIGPITMVTKVTDQGYQVQSRLLDGTEVPADKVDTSIGVVFDFGVIRER